MQQAAVSEFQVLFATPLPKSKSRLATTCNVSQIHNPLNFKNMAPAIGYEPIKLEEKNKSLPDVSNTKGKFFVSPTIMPLIDSNKDLGYFQFPPPKMQSAVLTSTNYYQKNRSPFLPKGKYAQPYVKSLSGRYRTNNNNIGISDISNNISGNNKLDPVQEKVKKGLSNYISIICSNRYKAFFY